MTIIRQLTWSVIGLLLLATRASAQDSQRDITYADSLVNLFVEKGSLSPWLPFKALEGCPDLRPWQEAAFTRLLDERLSAERENDLARAWGLSLATCEEPRLLGWFSETMRRRIESGADANSLLEFWTALERARSPAVGDLLEDLMRDQQVDEDIRFSAGAIFFANLEPERRLGTFFSYVERGELPPALAWAQFDSLLQRWPAQVADAIVLLGARNPAVLIGMKALLVAKVRHAPQFSRERIADALRAAARQLESVTEREAVFAAAAKIEESNK